MPFFTVTCLWVVKNLNLLLFKCSITVWQAPEEVHVQEIK